MGGEGHAKRADRPGRAVSPGVPVIGNGALGNAPFAAALFHAVKIAPAKMDVLHRTAFDRPIFRRNAVIGKNWLSTAAWLPSIRISTLPSMCMVWSMALTSKCSTHTVIPSGTQISKPVMKYFFTCTLALTL